MNTIFTLKRDWSRSWHLHLISLRKYGGINFKTGELPIDSKIHQAYGPPVFGIKSYIKQSLKVDEPISIWNKIKNILK